MLPGVGVGRLEPVRNVQTEHRQRRPPDWRNCGDKMLGSVSEWQ